MPIDGMLGVQAGEETSELGARRDHHQLAGRDRVPRGFDSGGPRSLVGGVLDDRERAPGRRIGDEEAADVGQLRVARGPEHSPRPSLRRAGWRSCRPQPLREAAGRPGSKAIDRPGRLARRHSDRIGGLVRRGSAAGSAMFSLTWSRSFPPVTAGLPITAGVSTTGFTAAGLSTLAGLSAVTGSARSSRPSASRPRPAFGFSASLVPAFGFSAAVASACGFCGRQPRPAALGRRTSAAVTSASSASAASASSSSPPPGSAAWPAAAAAMSGRTGSRRSNSPRLLEMPSSPAGLALVVVSVYRAPSPGPPRSRHGALARQIAPARQTSSRPLPSAARWPRTGW